MVWENAQKKIVGVFYRKKHCISTVHLLGTENYNFLIIFLYYFSYPWTVWTVVAHGLSYPAVIMLFLMIILFNKLC